MKIQPTWKKGRVVALILVCFLLLAGLQIYLATSRKYLWSDFDDALIQTLLGSVKFDRKMALKKITANIDNQDGDELIFTATRWIPAIGFQSTLYVAKIKNNAIRTVFVDKLGESVDEIRADDLNGDGQNELAILFTSGKMGGIKIYRWDGQNFQNLIWEEEGLEPYGRGGIKLKDLDGDGIVEVIVTMRDYEIEDKIAWTSEIYRWNPTQQKWQRSNEKIGDVEREKILAQILSAKELEEEVSNPYFSQDAVRDFFIFQKDIDKDGKDELIASVNIGWTGVVAVFEKQGQDFTLLDIKGFTGKQGLKAEIKDATGDGVKEIIVVNYKHPGTDIFIEEFFVLGYINEKIYTLWKDLQRDAMFGLPENCYQSKAQIRLEDLDGDGINEIVSLETYYDYSYEERQPLLDSKRVTRQVFRFDGQEYVKQYEEVLQPPALK